MIDIKDAGTPYWTVEGLFGGFYYWVKKQRKCLFILGRQIITWEVNIEREYDFDKGWKVYKTTRKLNHD